MFSVVAIVLGAFPLMAAEKTLLPLKVGTTWTYVNVGQEDRFVVQIVREELVTGQLCQVMEARIRNRPVASEHVAFTTDGFSRFRTDRDIINPALCFLKSPLSEDVTTWERRFRVGSRTTNATFSAEPADVTVPLGKFKSIAVTAETTDGIGRVKTKIWYAPDIGIVKQVVEEGKRPPVTLELEKLNLPK